MNLFIFIEVVTFPLSVLLKFKLAFLPHSVFFLIFSSANLSIILHLQLIKAHFFTSFILQWQAGSKQPAAPEGFEPDKNNWGWNWLERWMAVRPWENRFLDINLKDGMMVSENDSAEGKNGSKTQIRSIGKKPISTIHSNIPNQKTGPSQSEGSGSSSSRSVALIATSALPSCNKPKAKPSTEELAGEAISRPSGIGPRSNSTPKERPAQMDSQAKKRLSLQGNGMFIHFMHVVSIL